MNWKAAAGIVLLLVSHRVVAGGMGDAFSQGQALGSTGVSSTLANVTAGQGTSVVPNYTGAAPESSYFVGGQGTLLGPASGKMSNCATGPAAATAYAQQDCDAVNFLARNPSTRPQITIGNNDPLVTGATTILADPTSVLGTTNGAYSACSTGTVSQPAQYTTEVCNQYTNMEALDCQKLLNVAVTQSQVYGDGQLVWQYNLTNTGIPPTPGYGYSIVKLYYSAAGNNFLATIDWYNGTTTIHEQFHIATTPPYTASDSQPLTGYGTFICTSTRGLPYVIAPLVNPSIGLCLGGAGCQGNTCNFNVSITYIAATTAPAVFPAPGGGTTITKSWNNQCSTLEARAK